MAEKKTTKKSAKTTAKTAEKKTTKKTPAKKSGTSASKTTPTKVETAVQDKSMVYLDFVARTKDDNIVYDTTLLDVAKEEGLFKENDRYEPALVVVGWNWLLGAVEEQLVGMKIGESKTIEVPPEKGAGLRDPSKIKKIPKVKLAKHGIRGYKGEEVKFGNERGIVTADLGRSVRVDFNSPFAGKTLVYDVTIKEIVLDKVEKLKAVLRRRIPGIPEDRYDVIVKKNTVTVELPQETRYIENIQYGEIGIAADILKADDGIDEVKIVTTFKRPEPPKDNVT
ncbi:MAG: FKBP-type peptidyl-prolyl cis-trans isomerase [Candidatus Thorarchaeota archaeon]|nr:FKBP-type peptidyl-prolyl cis-trans isomerase [Candidatus Thorarchaeota archaeon]